MIGNDIVDLGHIKANPHHPRFASKILNEHEINQLCHIKKIAEPISISCISEADLFVWKCWSAKEAAYKALRRNNPELKFIPRKLTLNGHYINFEEKNFPVNFHINESYLMCEVGAPRRSLVRSLKELRLPESLCDTKKLSQGVRQIGSLLLGGGITFTEGLGGQPIAWKNGDLLHTPVSFTHHGTWMGVSAGYSCVDEISELRM